METPIIVLGRTELCTSYFVKARVCKKNFVMHEYRKGRPLLQKRRSLRTAVFRY